MTIRILLGLIMAAAAVGTAQARSPIITDPSGIVSVVVSAADLNLSRADGAEALLNRLRQAATVACGGQPSIGDLQETHDFEACRREALDHAVGQIRVPLVAALYRGHGSGTLAAAGGPG